jgi:hypothetical protein
MSLLVVAGLLAGVFFVLHLILRRSGNEGRYNRASVIGAAIVIAIAWGLFAATHLGFITDHAP